MKLVLLVGRRRIGGLRQRKTDSGDTTRVGRPNISTMPAVELFDSCIKRKCLDSEAREVFKLIRSCDTFGTVAEIEIDSLSTSMCISITVDAQSSSKWLCLYHNHPPGYLSLSPLRLAACYDEPLASVFTKDADMRLVYVAYKDESISALTNAATKHTLLPCHKLGWFL